MAGPNIPIDPPVRAPRQGGLSDVATFRPNERLGIAASLVYQTNGCAFPNREELRCYADPAPADKTADGITLEDGIGAPFVLYGSTECLIGPDPDQADRAKRTLAEGRDRGLESEIQAWLAAGVGLVAGVTVSDAIAQVEQALDQQYLGQGVIHLSRADAVRASAEYALYREGGKLYTINGTPVVASGNYPQGTVYGSGSIVVEESSAQVRQVEHLEFNKRFALAEAVYAIAVDCEFRVKSAVTPAP